MRMMVVYDSVYGNTEKIAMSISQAAAEKIEVKTVRVSDADVDQLGDGDILVIGSPTHNGRPTEGIIAFIDNMFSDALHSKFVTAFDTRYASSEKTAGVRFFMMAAGYAAQKIARKLVKKGGNLVVRAEGFIVEGREGPLRTGEVERARLWASSVLDLAK